MFDYMVNNAERSRAGSSRLITGTISMLAHGAVLVILAIPALYATDALPTPPDMLAFVVETAATPPPPPPPPPSAVTKAAAKRVTKSRPAPPTPRPPVERTEPLVAAPVEAPEGIAEETGL